MELTDNQIAARKRWENVPKEERSRRMRIIAKIKNDRMTAEEKHAQGLKMVKARHFRPVRSSVN